MTHFAVARQAVYGDGIDYWSYLHSWYFDHDLNFENEFRHMWSPEGNNNLSIPAANDIQKTIRTPLHKVDNIHPFGMPLLLFPFFVIADSLVAGFNSIGIELPRNGYSDIYQLICGIGAILYGTFGLYIVEKTCRKLGFKPVIARGAILILFFSTNLIYYLSYDVLNSHFASFFMVSIFWYYLISTPKKTLQNYIFLGFIIGITTLIRLQEIFLVIPVVIELVYNTLRKNNSVIESLTYGLIAGTSLSLCILPLLIQWISLYGSIFSYTEFVNIKPTGKPLLDSILNTNNGLFLITPILGVVFIFIPVVFNKIQNKVVFFSLVVYFLLQIFIIARHGGYMGSSYGGRMYISSTLLFTVLLSWLLTYSLKHEICRKIIILCTILLVVFNMISITNFVLFSKEASGGQRGLEKSTKERIEKLIKL